MLTLLACAVMNGPHGPNPTQQMCEAAIEAGHKMSASPTRDFLLMEEGAIDVISFEPLEHDQVAYVLDASRTAPIKESTLRRLYITGPIGPTAPAYRVNPFTNLPLKTVSPVVVVTKREEV